MKQAIKRERTRASVLGAASKVFRDRGYHEATLRAIAAEAGVSKGALYYNFESKEDLFLAILEQRVNERVEEIERAFAEADSGPGEQAQAAALDYMETLRESDEWFSLFFEFVAYAGRDPDFQAEFGRRLKQVWSTLTRVIESRAGARAADLPVSAEQLAVGIHALGIGLAVERVADPTAVPDELLGTMLSLVFKGASVPDDGGGQP